MEFILIGIILLFILTYNGHINHNKFIEDITDKSHFLMESDYPFYVKAKYGASDEKVEELFAKRIRLSLIVVVVFFFALLQNMNFLSFIFCFIIGFVVFKLEYFNVKGHYKQNLNKINMYLPYYLKSLEILIQHYTVPVALSKSVDSAPDIFKDGLRRMIKKIEMGDSTIDPYMEFAKEYPVRDSMRMMRLLYRLSLGSQENKQEQMILFSRSVSSLQNKAREMKYQERLDKMEKKTMVMLMATGGGMIALLMVVMGLMLNI